MKQFCLLLLLCSCAFLSNAQTTQERYARVEVSLIGKNIAETFGKFGCVSKNFATLGEKRRKGGEKGEKLVPMKEKSHSERILKMTF